MAKIDNRLFYHHETLETMKNKANVKCPQHINLRNTTGHRVLFQVYTIKESVIPTKAIDWKLSDFITLHLGRQTVGFDNPYMHCHIQRLLVYFKDALQNTATEAVSPTYVAGYLRSSIDAFNYSMQDILPENSHCISGFYGYCCDKVFGTLFSLWKQWGMGS